MREAIRVTRQLSVLTCLGGLLILPAAASAQTRSLNTAARADVASGQRIFDAQCAWCHGAGGTGGTGPDLHRTQLRHAANDRELVNIVRNGINGTEMPSFAIASHRLGRN